MAKDDLSKHIAGLEAFAKLSKAMQQKAMRKMIAVVKPALMVATPTRVDEKQGGNSLLPGELKAAVRGRVHVGDGTPDNPSLMTVDFGKLGHIARFVDGGHQAPRERALTKAGATSRRITHRPTPPKPFVRQVEDQTKQAAKEAYVSSMRQQMNKVLRG